MPSQADLAAAFARMRQNNANANASAASVGYKDLNNVYGRNLGNVSSVPPMSFGSSGSGDDDTPLWMKALTGLSATGKIVTDTLANATSGHWADNILTQAWRGQKEAWNDGSLGAGDIPGLGALYGIGKYGKGFGETLHNLGAKPGGYLEKIGGLEGDLLLDPLNFMTFGAGSAVKAGAKAAQVTAKTLAKEAGIVAGKDAVKSVPEALANAYRAKWKDVADIDPYQLEDLAKGIHADTTRKILDAGAAARNQAQNAAISLDVPFTNITKPLLQKSSIPGIGKYLTIADRKVGSTGAAAVNDLFRTVGLNPDDPAHAAQISKMLAEKFGVSSADQLTTQGLKHLQDEIGKLAGTADAKRSMQMRKILNEDFGGRTVEHLTPEELDNYQAKLSALTGDVSFNPRVDSTHIANDLNPTMHYNKFDVDAILSKLRNPQYGASFLEKYGLKGAETSRLASEAPDILDHQASKLFDLSNSTKPSIANKTDDMRTLSDALRGAENTASIKYNPSAVYKHLESLAAADRMTGQRVGANLRKFVQDAGGSSKLGTSLSKFNVFNPRSFGSDDPLANEAAGALRDTQGKVSGLTRHTNEQIGAINKQMDGLSEAEKRSIPYYIEGAFPKAFDKSSIDETKVQAIANQMKSVLHVIGDQDVASGAIQSKIQNYFPHVMKPDVQEFKGDPDVARILGKNQTTGFGKERQGFDNLAQLDDAIATLKSEAAAATDPARSQDLLAKATQLEGLFERDPITALGNRMYESVKTSAMSELYTKLEKDGLIVKALDETNVDRGFNAAKKGYHTLDKAEAGALGLPAGTQIHQDVFEGMKDVRELFTMKGMNSFVSGMNKAVSVWKSLVTSYVPAHYLNNFIGNIANNTLAGVKPGSYSKANELLKAAKAGTLSPEQEKIMKEAYEQGVFGQGFSSEFVKSRFSTDKVTRVDKITEALTHNTYAKGMRKFGDKIDDFSRMALFLHGIEQTGSFSQAGKMVSKYLFNYNIQSNADKAIRTVVPFWTWTKNNLPLQIQGMMQQPRYYETYQRVREAFNADVPDQKGKEYQKQDYLHIPGTNRGIPLRSMPMNDLSTFASNPLDTLRNLMGNLSPALKVTPEIALNKQFFNGQPIYHQDDDPTTKIGKYLLNQTGIGGKLANVATSQDGSSLLDNLAAILGGKPTVYK